MKMFRIALVLVGGAVAWSSLGCGGASWQQKIEAKIRTQASFDLGCEGQKIKLTQIGENAVAMGHMYTYGAEGCEKKATYKGVCASMGGCNANMDGSVQSGGASSASAAEGTAAPPVNPASASPSE